MASSFKKYMPRKLLNIAVPFYSLLSFNSCKVEEPKLIGVYQLKEAPKTILIINADKTFEFQLNTPNPYLHPFPHPDEMYFITKGTWKIKDVKTLYLTSKENNSYKNPVEITSAKPAVKDYSTFIFLDVFGDTVPVSGVWTSRFLAARLHGYMPEYSQKLNNPDTLHFDFFGYPTWKFINTTSQNTDYIIYLSPESKPSFFYNTPINIKRSRLFFGKLKFRMIKRTK